MTLAFPDSVSLFFVINFSLCFEVVGLETNLVQCDTVDNDVVFVLTVVEDNGVLKLHRERGQVLNPV